ncbi:SanA/YdcF family protein [Tenacibaculum mesophilum]|uniref:Vancomycin high temperature exclusion protein n=1 Tax=Tenacibaculum mesophilum TaxID=104268 RepID=A0ABN5T257_9FLAO|nr:ElyC/SanA/YdcF family protein [Tenacibaculum mesophilum]AZJ31335.1 vancomycin high temperature exclusion protein [Tenacibaculum mesophilum]QFS29383.1 vancomycin high temperature exclusion protein [Tenacibaculum mesophilum]SHF97734.1 SanA protein [Tenacibaculum mesophilum]
MKRKKVAIIFLLGCLLVVTSIYVSNKVIVNNAEGKLFNSTENISKNKVGLLLGTVKYLSDGRINLYYQFRLNAAVELYKAEKIDFILVSGDNGSEGYDEPTDFKNDLIESGIPESKIYLDYAGFRTLDSMVRVKEIFGQTSVTIISQQFHNERALYLANHFDIEAIGYNARGVSGKKAMKVQLREYLARVKVFVDILLNVNPKFLGEPVEIK